MRRVAWSGQIPSDHDDARRRITDAAVRCVGRHGIERTSVAMIASEAGVSKPTLYAYFENRDEIVNKAIATADESFAEAVIAHARTFDTAAGRLVEGTLFAMREVWGEPALAIGLRRGQALHGPITADEVHFARLCLGPVVELSPQLGGWLDEAAEVVARMMISLIDREPVDRRTEAEDRAFLHRWWPRALGIDARPVEGRTSTGSRSPTRPAADDGG